NVSNTLAIRHAFWLDAVPKLDVVGVFEVGVDGGIRIPAIFALTPHSQRFSSFSTADPFFFFCLPRTTAKDKIMSKLTQCLTSLKSTQKQTPKRETEFPPLCVRHTEVVVGYCPSAEKQKNFLLSAKNTRVS